MILKSVDKLPLSIRIYIAVFCVILSALFFKFIPDELLLQVPLYLYLLDFGLNFIKEIYLWGKARKDGKDLHPYFTKMEVAKATRYFIPTRSQEIAPEIQEGKDRRYMRASSELLIPKMLKYEFAEEGERYFLVLADSGMGKTTFMINLYLAYQRQWQKKYKIKLLPFGYPNLINEIEKIPDQRNTILLLDAFDEDNKAVRNYKTRLNSILKKTKEFRKLLITCRTQFFSSQWDEPHATGEFKFGPEGGQHYFRKVYVSPFNEKDIKSYLHKRFPFGLFQYKKRKKAWRIVNNSPSLMVRPMLLSHIEDLVTENKEYQYNYQVYEVLIEKWMEREARKPGIEEMHGSKRVFKQKLEKFSRDLSVELYKNRDRHKVKWALHKNDKLFSVSELFHNPSEDESETIGSSEWRSRSLLNRDVDGYYKFSHKSVMEYFLAVEAFENIGFYEMMDFGGMDAAGAFFLEILNDKIGRNIHRVSIPLLIKEGVSAKIKDTLVVKSIHVHSSVNTFDFSKLLFFRSKFLKEVKISDLYRNQLLYDLYYLFLMYGKAHVLNRFEDIKFVLNYLNAKLFWKHLIIVDVELVMSKILSDENSLEYFRNHYKNKLGSNFHHLRIVNGKIMASMNNISMDECWKKLNLKNGFHQYDVEKVEAFLAKSYIISQKMEEVKFYY